MSTLIVAFPKIEEAKAVRNLLVRKGYEVAIPCITGAQVINQADNLSDISMLFRWTDKIHFHIRLSS